MKVAFFLFVLTLATSLRAGEEGEESPAAAQFRKHLETADQDKDGWVTAKELNVEIIVTAKRDLETSAKVVEAMMKELDTDLDGKLGPEEISAGARRVADHAAMKTSIQRAQLLMVALAEYEKAHEGVRPTTLEELVELQLVSGKTLQCALANGGQQPWRYEAGNGSNKNTVILISPEPIGPENKYIVGLVDGRTLGMSGGKLDLEGIPRLKMEVYSDE